MKSKSETASSKNKNDSSNKNLIPLHLQLPYVAAEKQRNPKLLALDLEIGSSGDEDNDEELFCRKHLIPNKRKVPSEELQELYEVLKNLPSISNAQSSSSIDKNKFLNMSRERTSRWVASTISESKRKERFLPDDGRNSVESTSVSHCPNSSSDSTSAKEMSEPQSSSPHEFSSASSIYFQVSEDVEYEERLEFFEQRREREVVKMHQINLFQSILPSTFFSRKYKNTN